MLQKYKNKKCSPNDFLSPTMYMIADIVLGNATFFVSVAMIFLLCFWINNIVFVVQMETMKAFLPPALLHIAVLRFIDWDAFKISVFVALVSGTFRWKWISCFLFLVWFWFFLEAECVVFATVYQFNYYNYFFIYSKTVHMVLKYVTELMLVYMHSYFQIIHLS